MAVAPDEGHSTGEPPSTGHGFHAGSSLSVDRAFVVHFGTDGGRRRRFCGRVEHLSTGRAARFSSLKALLGFVAAFLDDSRPAAPPSPTDRTRTMNEPPARDPRGSAPAAPGLSAGLGDVDRSKGGASR